MLWDLGLEKQEGLLGVNSTCKEARGHHLDVIPQDVVIVVWPGDGVQIHNAEDAVDAAILQSCPMLDSTEVVA